MSTRTSLRRSRRAPKKHLSEYNVGDLVEIERNNTVLKARLVQLLTEGSQVHPRWLVKVEGLNKDEEVYEHTFIKVLETAELEGTGSSGEVEAPPKSRPAPVNNTKKTNNNNKNSRKHDDSNEDIKMTDASVEAVEQQKRSTANSNESSPSGEESSSVVDTESAKVSAREERSRRRQAIIDEYGVLTGAALSNGKRKVGNANSSNGGGGNNNNNNKHSKNNKRAKTEDDEKCTKVKMLTGTLYLYRGRRPRAEFVRRV